MLKKTKICMNKNVQFPPSGEKIDLNLEIGYMLPRFLENP